jgi:hypothetical protein
VSGASGVSDTTSAFGGLSSIRNSSPVSFRFKLLCDEDFNPSAVELNVKTPKQICTALAALKFTPYALNSDAWSRVVKEALRSLDFRQAVLGFITQGREIDLRRRTGCPFELLHDADIARDRVTIDL